MCVTHAPVAAEEPPRTYRYHPNFRVAPSLEAVDRSFAAGSDEFPEEKVAEDLASRLTALSTALRESVSRGAGALDALLTADFKGAPAGCSRHRRD
jgi:hypothetical protein